jgi:Zn-dependent peptidase ImmA (M78 family)
VAHDLRSFPESVAFAYEMHTLLEHHRTARSALSRLKWAAGQHLQQAAQDARRLAGLTNDDRNDETIQALLGLADDGMVGLITPITIPAMLFRSASPELSTTDLRRLSEAFAQLPSVEDCSLIAYQQADPPTASPDIVFQDGYEKALEFRSALGINPELPLLGEHDLETVLFQSLGIVVQDLTLENATIDGMAVFSPGLAPLVGVNLTGRFSSTRWGRRMTLAHELCHLLYDLSEDNKIGIVSSSWAPELLEKRANAFAAMLMMPREALKASLPLNPRQWTAEDLGDAMKKLGVGRTALMNHLHNLGFIGYSEKEAWLDEL